MLRLAVVAVQHGNRIVAAQHSKRFAERHRPEFLENFGLALGKPFGPAFRLALCPHFILNFLLDIANERSDAHVQRPLWMQQSLAGVPV